MILVDSSVRVDYFNGVRWRESDFLDSTLGQEPIAFGDLILTEILQGFRSDANYQMAKSFLLGLTVFELLRQELAVRAADNYPALRRRGVTFRKTVDCIIATFCIEQGPPLLYSDRDFEPFARSLGLVSALPAT